MCLLVFCISSAWCHGLVCDMRLWHFVDIITCFLGVFTIFGSSGDGVANGCKKCQTNENTQISLLHVRTLELSFISLTKQSIKYIFFTLLYQISKPDSEIYTLNSCLSSDNCIYPSIHARSLCARWEGSGQRCSHTHRPYTYPLDLEEERHVHE